MEVTPDQEAKDSLASVVYEIPGEPAIIINGVPESTTGDVAFIPNHINGGTGLCGSTGFGRWLEGRDVRKLFCDQFYNGSVTNFDSENGWYHVVYEDGDSEDLDWHELKEVLLPLDINIPLRTLALRLGKQNPKSFHGSVKDKSCVKARRGRKRKNEMEAQIMKETMVKRLNSCGTNGLCSF